MVSKEYSIVDWRADLRGITICEASLQNPQNVAQNVMIVILDYNLISLIKL